MMQLHYIKLLLKRLLIILLLFSLCRILFYFFHQNLFPNLTAAEFAKALFWGLRFDISAILYFNFIVILLHVIPHPFRNKNRYKAITKWVYLISNAAALLLLIIDLEYFKHTLNRTTIAVLGMKDDIIPMIPDYLMDFWYLLLVFVGLIFLSRLLYNRTEKAVELKSSYILQSIFAILFIGITVIGMRGGIQLKPITPITAAQYVEPGHMAVVTNTPFNFIHSTAFHFLEEKNFMPPEEAQQEFAIYHEMKNDEPFRKKNVMIIIMESFAKEFVGAVSGYPKSYTPFLDSLAGHSLVFTNAYANGKKSQHGLAAIAASIPALMGEPFMSSAYQQNKFLGLGTILKEQGYTTAFFHGADNGSMSFDHFISAAGFGLYFGKNEYGNDKDYDTRWGIFDEPFFQFTAGEINKFPQPFCAILFSISSHQPYFLPEKYKEAFPEESLEIHKTVRYADMALKNFFETASQMSWYDSTLFIITADHTAAVEKPYSFTAVGRYSIPLMMFDPSGRLKGKNNDVVQQADIMPTILDYLNYSGKYTAFGKSMLATNQERYVFQYNRSGFYQILDDEYAYLWDGEKPLGLYKYRQDTLLNKNLIHKLPEEQEKLERKLKAVVQMYNNSLIENKLSPQ